MLCYMPKRIMHIRERIEESMEREGVPHKEAESRSYGVITKRYGWHRE